MVNILHRVQVVFGQTGAENIGRGFQQISQYGNQANTTIGTANTQLNKFGTEAQTAGSGVSIFGRNMGTLAGSTTQANQGISIFGQGLTKVSGGLTTTNTLIGTANTQQKTLGASLLSNGKSFATMAVGMATTIQGVVGLSRAFRDLNDQQLGVDRAARKLSVANEAVDKSTRKLRELAQANKQGTQEWTDALRDQTQAQEQQNIAVTNLSEAQERLHDTQEDFVFLTISTVLGTVGTLISAFNSFDIKLSTIIPKLKNFGGALKTALGGISGVGAVAGGAAGGLIGGLVLTDIATQTQKVFDKYAKTYDPAKRTSALGATFGTPEQQKAYVAETVENQEKMAKAGVNVIDMLSDYFLHTDNVDKKLAAYNATAKEAATTTENVGKAAQPIVTGYNAAATSTIGLVNHLVVLRTAAENGTGSWNTYFAEIEKSVPAAQHFQIMGQVEELMKKNTTATTTATAATAKAIPIEQLLAAERAKQVQIGLQLAQTNFDMARGNEDMNKTLAATAEGSKQGVLQFEQLRDKTIMAQQAEKLFRSSLIEALQPFNQHVDLTQFSTEKLALMYRVLLGDTTAMKELNKVTLENAAFVDDMANKYGQKLIPNMQLTTDQIKEATAAFDALNKAVTELKDPSELFGLKDFKVKFEVEDEFHDFMKSLPKGLRQDITFTVKSEAANENAKKLMGLFAKTELQIPVEVQLKRGDKGADQFVDDMIKSIKDTFHQKGKDLKPDPQTQEMINKLLEIKEAPDSWQKLTQYFQSPSFLATIRKLDPHMADIIESMFPPATKADFKTQAASIANAINEAVDEATDSFFSQKGNKKKKGKPLDIKDRFQIMGDATKNFDNKAINIPVTVDTKQAETNLANLTKSAGSAWQAATDLTDSLAAIPDVSPTVNADATATDALGKSAGTAWTASEDLNESVGGFPDSSGVVSSNTGAIDALAKSAGTAWTAQEDLNDSISNSPDASSVISKNSKAIDDLAKSAGTAWNAVSDMNDALDDVPNVSSTIKKNANAMDDLAKSAGSAWSAITDVSDALDEVDGKKVKATVEVEFKATGDQIAIDKAKGGGQHGLMWISNAAQIYKGKRISEFNKPELNITIPLSRNPSNITTKETVPVPTGMSGMSAVGVMGGGGSQTLHLRIDGNEIVRDSDLYFSVVPQMGRKTGQYSH